MVFFLPKPQCPACGSTEITRDKEQEIVLPVFKCSACGLHLKQVSTAKSWWLIPAALAFIAIFFLIGPYIFHSLSGITRVAVFGGFAGGAYATIMQLGSALAKYVPAGKGKA